MTIGGNEPMMAAEALASIDIAWIFSAIFLRSRSTLERLPSASDRLQPDFCWIATAMPAAPTSPPPAVNARKKPAAARTPEMIQNFWVDQFRPARVMRVLRGTDFS